MHAVRHENKVSDSLRMGLFSRQVTSGFFVFYGTAEGRYSASRLEVEGRACSDQVVGSRSVPQTKFLTFLEHSKWGRRVTYLPSHLEY